MCCYSTVAYVVGLAFRTVADICLGRRERAGDSPTRAAADVLSGEQPVEYLTLVSEPQQPGGMACRRVRRCSLFQRSPADASTVTTLNSSHFLFNHAAFCFRAVLFPPSGISGYCDRPVCGAGV